MFKRVFFSLFSHFNWLFTQTLSDNYHVLMYYCLFVCIDVDLEEATVRSSIWIQLLKPCRSSLYQPSSAPPSLDRCVLIYVHSLNEWKHNTNSVCLRFLLHINSHQKYVNYQCDKVVLPQVYAGLILCIFFSSKCWLISVIKFALILILRLPWMQQ